MQKQLKRKRGGIMDFDERDYLIQMEEKKTWSRNFGVNLFDASINYFRP